MPKMNFLKRVHATPKVKAIKKKIATNERARKKLSGEYKRAIKSESKRLAAQIKKSKPKKKKRR